MLIGQGVQPGAPGAYVELVPAPPQINGVPTNILGIVGIASWGPVNMPNIIGSSAELVDTYGPVLNATHDLGTAVTIAMQQGANAIFGVRVTDGSDTKASVELMDTDTTPAEGALLTAIYSGTVGNSITAAITAGVQPSTYTLTITRPGVLTETFANIGGTGSAFWENLVNAVNQGQGPSRGPSQLVTASLPSTQSTYAPNVTTTYTLAGGTNGNGSVTDTTLLGSDGPPRTGMYALRGTGCQVGMLADVTTSSTFTNQVSFGLQEGIYMIGVGPGNQTISQAISVKSTAGIGSHAFKLLLGDWIYWYDETNAVQRVVSPQAFVAGLLVSLNPAQAALNKQVFGVIDTQTSMNGYRYSYADLEQLTQNGIDLITNPIPQGNAFGDRIGVNTSFNAVNQFDNYTRMTNFLSATFNKATGIFDGKVQTPKLWAEVETTFDDFLANLKAQGLIEAYQVTVNQTNNPQSQQALGFMNIQVSVTYFGIAAYIIVSLNGGTSVVISQSTLGQAA